MFLVIIVTMALNSIILMPWLTYGQAFEPLTSDVRINRINLSTSTHAIAIDPSGKIVYLASGKTISVIDSTTDRLAKNIALKHFPYKIAVDPGTIVF